MKINEKVGERDYREEGKGCNDMGLEKKGTDK